MVYPMKKLYKMRNQSSQGWVYSIKHKGLYFHLYKFFSSRSAAIKGMKWLLKTWGGKGTLAYLTVAKTEKGWGVFQSSRSKQFQITDRNAGQYLVK